MDKLGKKLVSIENKLGGSEPVPSSVQDKLGWHLEYIESLIGGGGGGGSTSAPVFDAEITEESGKIVVSMSEEDKNDIYSHKYPVIGIHIVDEEENDIVLYFKIRIAATEANAIVYDNWDSEDGNISQMELTFMWDGDDVKVTFETNDFIFNACYNFIDLTAYDTHTIGSQETMIMATQYPELQGVINSFFENYDYRKPTVVCFKVTNGTVTNQKATASDTALYSNEVEGGGQVVLITASNNAFGTLGIQIMKTPSITGVVISSKGS